MKSYKYKCPICGSERDIISQYPNEIVYCITCSGKQDLPALMKQIKVNINVNVGLLLEDDHK